jgi:hypothetical protein
MDPLLYVVLFQLVGFLLLWFELKRYQRRLHDLVDRYTGMHAGLVLLLMDQAERLARLEGVPFRPASVFERLDLDTQDAESQRVLRDIQHLILKRRNES